MHRCLPNGHGVSEWPLECSQKSNVFLWPFRKSQTVAWFLWAPTVRPFGRGKCILRVNPCQSFQHALITPSTHAPTLLANPCKLPSCGGEMVGSGVAGLGGGGEKWRRLSLRLLNPISVPRPPPALLIRGLPGIRGSLLLAREFRENRAPRSHDGEGGGGANDGCNPGPRAGSQTGMWGKEGGGGGGKQDGRSSSQTRLWGNWRLQVFGDGRTEPQRLHQ